MAVTKQTVRHAVHGPDTPRYLIPFDLRRQFHLETDVLVIGGGVAGLSAALAAADAGSTVIILAKTALSESNTAYAQGGVAGVLHECERETSDSIQAHVHDTMIAGAGLCDEECVTSIAEYAADALGFLREHGCDFDINDSGNVALTREGGHSARRILHANGDATGREISRSLAEAVRQHPHITIHEHVFVIDLLDAGPEEQGHVHGALFKSSNNNICAAYAPACILATGGCGQMWRETSNPSCATGDGLAMAWRTGATLTDLEFMQFHPTCLYIAGAPRSLITEAMRGEGAYLKNHNGERFMCHQHELAELAPRDIVSSAIVNEIRSNDFPHVWLDASHLDNTFLRNRFPTITATCNALSIDITNEWIPVHPAAHYHCGGIQTDHTGRTNVPGLYAVGEVACTGLHGANRLASNSLLEGLVVGLRAGHSAHKESAFSGPRALVHTSTLTHAHVDISDLTHSLRALMWQRVGISRTGKSLNTAIRSIDFWSQHQANCLFSQSTGWELQNMLTTGGLIARAARSRPHSVGTHRRRDTTDENIDTHTLHYTFTHTPNHS